MKGPRGGNYTIVKGKKVYGDKSSKAPAAPTHSVAARAERNRRIMKYGLMALGGAVTLGAIALGGAAHSNAARQARHSKLPDYREGGHSNAHPDWHTRAMNKSAFAVRSSQHIPNKVARSYSKKAVNVR